MPPSSFAHRSGINRLAGLALYKALLKQCHEVKLPNKPKEQLRNVLRNKFESNRDVVGVQTVKEALQTGYEALDLLTKTNASYNPSTSLSNLKRLLSHIPPHLRHSRKPRPQPSTKKRDRPSLEAPTTSSSSSTLASTIKPPSILQRPRPHSALPPGSTRHVPVWVEANGIPFLRIKKPIPNTLSCYINNRVRRRQNRTDHINTLDFESLKLAEYEDHWDDVISHHSTDEGVVLWEESVVGEVRGRQKTAERASSAQMRREKEIVGVKWVDAVYENLRELRIAGGREAADNLKMSMAMKRVVREEKVLAEEERKFKGNEKRRERRARKRGMVAEEEEAALSMTPVGAPCTFASPDAAQDTAPGTRSPWNRKWKRMVPSSAPSTVSATVRATSSSTFVSLGTAPAAVASTEPYKPVRAAKETRKNEDGRGMLEQGLADWLAKKVEEKKS